VSGVETGVTAGILPSSLRLFKIAPGDLVGIDIETCPACGGAVRSIACIEDSDVIEQILTHLDAKASEPETPRRPPCRAPPRRGLFDETDNPRMTSSGLCPRSAPLLAPIDQAAFSALVTRTFAQRRKTLRNNSKGWLDAEQIDRLGIDPGTRGERLAIDELIRSFRATAVGPRAGSA